MKKYAIYSACIGRYDNIAQPPVIDERFDYIVFCDQVPEKQSGIWRIVQTPEMNDLSPIYMARYIKTHPHELLPQYDAWIWIDTNLAFADNYFFEVFDKWYASSNVVAANPHPATDDVYEHIYEMCCWGFEHDETCLKTMRYLQEQHYPAHNGLCETGILFRKNTLQLKQFDERWWWHILNLSKRDQFSFNYVLTELEVPWENILPADEPIRKTKHVVYTYHADGASKRKLIQFNREEKIRDYIRRQHPSIYLPFVKQYMRMSLHDNYSKRLRMWGWMMFPLHVLNPIYTYRLIQRKLTKKHKK